MHYIVAWDAFYDQNGTSQVTYYNITIDTFLAGPDLKMYKISKPLFQTSVPGNQTSVEVTNITGPSGTELKILIVAKSIGGKSDEQMIVYHLKGMKPKRLSPEKATFFFKNCFLTRLGEASLVIKALEKLWVFVVIIIILGMTVGLIFYVRSYLDRMNRSREQKKKFKVCMYAYKKLGR